MGYYAVFLPMKDEEKSKIFRENHLNFLKNLRDDGTIIMNGRFNDGSGGLVIYRVDNLEDVEKLVKTDPYIVNGARDYKIHEWEMVSNYKF